MAPLVMHRQFQKSARRGGHLSKSHRPRYLLASDSKTFRYTDIISALSALSATGVESGISSADADTMPYLTVFPRTAHSYNWHKNEFTNTNLLKILKTYFSTIFLYHNLLYHMVKQAIVSFCHINNFIVIL